MAEVFFCSMSAKDKVRQNKTDIQSVLSADYRLILNKVYEKKLITSREYNNLKCISRENVEGHVIELVDKLMSKGDNTCQAFLNLLQTDEDIRSTCPELERAQWANACLETEPVQATCPVHRDVLPPDIKRQKQDEQYQLTTWPTGICVIVNNENFENGNVRCGTDKDAQSLAEVFSWLGFRVLMCKDQTNSQMDGALKCLASLSGIAQLQDLNVKEWSGSGFFDLQELPQHGDAFICCILSHGAKGGVKGTNGEFLSIKEITTTFKANNCCILKGKPKVFLIQACQGQKVQGGVLAADLEADASPNQPVSIPVEADFLVAISTVEDFVSFRHKTDGSWFIQSLCQQLKERCPRGDDIIDILHHVNKDVSQKEGSEHNPGAVKQMPEVRFTLTKRLVLSPHH